MEEEIHISSLVIQTLPEHFEPFINHCREHSAIEVAQSDQTLCKIVLIVEAKTTKIIGDLLDELKCLPGVLHASLIYHHVEDPLSLKEEMI